METVSYDVETTGLSPWLGAEMFAWSTCTGGGDVDIRRLDREDAARNQKRLATLFDNTEVAKVGHNIKFDLHFTEKALGREIPAGTVIHDTMLQAAIVQNDFVDRKLKRLAWELFGYARDDEEAVKAFVREGGNYSHVPEELMDEYQYHDAVRTMILHKFFMGEIEKNPRWVECYQNEIDLIPVTMRMERRGLRISRGKAERLRDELLAESEELISTIEQELGTRINPESPDELAWGLFEVAGLPVLKRTEKAKKPCTDKFALRELHERHPECAVIGHVLRYRSRVKGAATMQRFLNHADDNGVIHPDILTCGAKTGREACKEPNLQNVQSTGKKDNPFPVPERSVFIPRPGYINVHVDYSSIEPRLQAEYAGDEAMIEAFRRGLDAHAVATAVFYGERFTKLKPGSKQWKTLRGAGKAANLAIPYGAGAPKVMKILGLRGRFGKDAFRRYAAEFPSLVRLNGETAGEHREQGYVVTGFGRHLRAPDHHVATNYLVQGTAAEILKRAQVRADAYCRKTTGDEVRLLLPIHDEIVLEYPRKRLKDFPGFIRGLKKVMTEFDEFVVPMDADVEIVTKHWADKKEWHNGAQL